MSTALCTGMYVGVELHAATVYKRNGKSPSLFPPDPIQRHGRAEAVANLNSHHSNKKALTLRAERWTFIRRTIDPKAHGWFFEGKLRTRSLHNFIFWAKRARYFLRRRRLWNWLLPGKQCSPE